MNQKPDEAAEQARFAALFYPGTDVLRNHQGIVDAARLAEVEAELSELRLDELRRGAVQLEKTFDAAHLQAIHRHVFGDLYPWAGEIRDYPLSKNDSRFAHYESVHLYLDAVAYDLRTRPELRAADPREFAAGMADVFAHVNTAHIFREGNGRTAREFMTEAAEELSQHRLDFASIRPAEWNEASRLSHPEPGRFSPDPTPLVPLFERATVPAGRAAETPRKASDSQVKSPEPQIKPAAELAAEQQASQQRRSAAAKRQQAARQAGRKQPPPSAPRPPRQGPRI